MIKCFVDTETTGLEIQCDHSVHQVAMILLDEQDEVITERDFKFRPHRSGFTHEAFKKCHLTPEEVMAREYTSVQCFDHFTVELQKYVSRFNPKDKMQLFAYNSKFDEQVLREWWKDHGDNFFGSYFWNPSICLYTVAGWFIRDHREKFTHLKLADICRFCDIDFDEDDAHDALYDIRKTVELYRALKTL